METLLYRWSTILQVVSDLMIALFFVVLTLTMRRPGLRLWTSAWLANVAALGVTVSFWIIQPQTRAAARPLTGSYSFFKTCFIILLIAGTLAYTRLTLSAATLRRCIVAALVFSILLATFSVSILSLGMVQSTMNGILFLLAAGLLLHAKPAGHAWLAMGFIMRGSLAVFEATVYMARFFAWEWSTDPMLEAYLASHSSFDAAAEWMIALGCVLMMYRGMFDELDSAKTRLQDLAERDELTGLYNRRSLKPLMNSVAAGGATVLFFDLNDFKGINDTFGHAAGDACLKRFADVLRDNFRPSDHVIRYAGDEFIVIAHGAHPDDVRNHVEEARQELAQASANTPPIRFSVGLSFLDVNGEPDKALREADSAMYLAKQAKVASLAG